ncbi:MAG: peptidylprolyl isomerase [Proteobacteria bacterium]|nr:MAG: peptidylprolyl isomerase [Pseudomonadota bacterium]
MKKVLLAAAVFSAASVSAVSAEGVKTLESDDQKVSYSFGMMLGKQMHSEFPALDIGSFVQGMKDAMHGGTPLLTMQQMQAAVQKHHQKQQMDRMAKFEKSAEENLKKGESFLAENKTGPGVKTTDSGLQYKVLAKGTGPRPGAEDTVTVHYEGSLIDGTVFDSSIQRGEPVSFAVNGVIPGWTEALQLMSEGDKWQLFIPSSLAYGPGGNRSIGPNEVLLFEVELLKVKKKEK